MREQALKRACPHKQKHGFCLKCLWLAAGIVISAEAGNKKNPDKPFTTVVFTAVVAATAIVAKEAAIAASEAGE